MKKVIELIDRISNKFKEDIRKISSKLPPMQTNKISNEDLTRKNLNHKLVMFYSGLNTIISVLDHNIPDFSPGESEDCAGEL